MPPFFKATASTRCPKKKDYHILISETVKDTSCFKYNTLYIFTFLDSTQNFRVNLYNKLLS